MTITLELLDNEVKAIMALAERLKEAMPRYEVSPYTHFENELGESETIYLIWDKKDKINILDNDEKYLEFKTEALAQEECDWLNRKDK